MPSRTAIVNEVLGAGKEQISARETWIDYSLAAIINKLTAHGAARNLLLEGGR